MNSQPLISFCMPIRNGGQASKIALESVVNQTYSNIEIVISDNNSTDETSEICKHFQSIDPRIKYFRQTNSLNMAQNARFVFDQATGDYVIFAAHDDTRSLNYAEVLMKKMLEKAGASLVFSDLVEFSELCEWQKNTSLIDYDYLSDYKDSFSKKINTLCHLKRYTHLFGLIPRKLLLDYSWVELDFTSDLVLLVHLACRGSFMKATGATFYYYRPKQGKLHNERAKSSFFHDLKPFPYLRLCFAIAESGQTAEKAEGRDRSFLVVFLISFYYLFSLRLKRLCTFQAIPHIIRFFAVKLPKKCFQLIYKIFCNNLIK